MGLRFLSDVLQRYAGLHLSGCLGSLVRIHVLPQNKQCSFQEKYSEDDLRDRLTEGSPSSFDSFLNTLRYVFQKCKYLGNSHEHATAVFG